jgi:hypothetical protein
MDAEAQVAQQLAKGLNRPTPQEPAVNTEENIEVEPLHNNLPIDNMQLKNDLMAHFMLSPGMRQNADVQDKIKTISEWAANNAPSTDLADILATINHQEAMMGSRLAGDRLDRFYMYVRLANQARMIQEKQRALYA